MSRKYIYGAQGRCAFLQVPRQPPGLYRSAADQHVRGEARCAKQHGGFLSHLLGRFIHGWPGWLDPEPRLEKSEKLAGFDMLNIGGGQHDEGTMKASVCLAGRAGLWRGFGRASGDAIGRDSRPSSASCCYAPAGTRTEHTACSGVTCINKRWNVHRTRRA